MATYYVRSGGSDSNNGLANTVGGAWLTLQKAANSTGPGDTVYVQLGLGAATFGGFNFNTGGGGSAGGGLKTFIANTGDYRTSGVTVSGLDSSSTAPIFAFNTSGYIVLKGFRVVNGNSGKGLIHMTGSPNCQVISCEADGSVATQPRWGMKFGEVDGILIQDCYCHDVPNEHGLYVSGTNGYTIKGCELSNNTWNGIHANVEDGTNTINTNGLIDGNYVHGNLLSGMDLESINNSRVVNNKVVANHKQGIVLQNGPQAAATYACHDNVIANNTIDTTGADTNPRGCLQFAAVAVQPGGTSWNTNMDGNTVFNNIFIPAAGHGCISTPSGDTIPASFKSDWNILTADRMSQDYATPTTETLATWRTNTGEDANTVISTTTALFANYATQDFTLNSTSPARNGGVGSFNGKAAPVNDFAGGTRPQGTATDIGAYEFPETSSPTNDTSWSGEGLVFTPVRGW